MKGLVFHFDDMQREVADFSALAKRFLDPSAETCLKVFADQLGIIRQKAPLASTQPGVSGKKYRWEIPANQALRTKPSRGYEKGKRKGGPEIYARITSVWDISPEPRKSNHDVSKHFHLTGNASVRVEWVDVGDDKSMGSWRMEIADDASPGPFFHTQILGDQPHPPFPQSVTVPRLPCMASTPMAVLEFVLGELFQDEWEKHSMNPSPQMESWRAIQRHRFLNLLAWQKELLKDCMMPPWTVLKTARPSPDLLLKRP